MINPKDYMLKLQGKEYLPVAPRAVMFRETHPNGRIVTRIISHTEALAVCEAEVYNNDGSLLSVAQGSCTVKGFKDYLEKAGTKAVGRALSLAGFGTIQAGDLDEGTAEDGAKAIVDTPIALQPLVQQPKAIVDTPQPGVQQPKANGRELTEQEIQQKIADVYKVQGKMAQVIARRFVEMKRASGKVMTEPDLGYIVSNWSLRDVKLRCLPKDTVAQYDGDINAISNVALDTLLLMDGQFEIPDDPFAGD